MQRNFAVTRRYPNGYNHELLDWQRNELQISIQEVARRTGQPFETVRKVFKGIATNKTVYRVVKVLGLDWSMVHRLDLPKVEFHLAVLNGSASGEKRGRLGGSGRSLSRAGEYIARKRDRSNSQSMASDK